MVCTLAAVLSVHCIGRECAQLRALFVWFFVVAERCVTQRSCRFLPPDIFAGSSQSSFQIWLSFVERCLSCRRRWQVLSIASLKYLIPGVTVANTVSGVFSCLCSRSDLRSRYLAFLAAFKSSVEIFFECAFQMDEDLQFFMR